MLNLSSRRLATVAFNMRPKRGPWGGSSPFVKQMEAQLERSGIAVQFDLTGHVDAIVIVDPREDLEGIMFGVPAIAAYRRRNPSVRVLHRVNECDQRKGTSFMDAHLARASQVADHTVFISEWLRDYHVARWFDASRPHGVIYNGADGRWFHPFGRPSSANRPFRVVTHHWSDNPLKGYDVYEAFDRSLVSGMLPGVEFWVIGRWPASIRWQATRTFPPARENKLGDLLRQCDAYLTASRWEPCGMHHVEGAQCGLPLIYHEDGGGIVEAGRRYGVGYRDDVVPAVSRMRAEYPAYRHAVLSAMPSGDDMVVAYQRVLRGLIAGACPA
jgi:glycosyltransferase involved in cell wall biosynthesis